MSMRKDMKISKFLRGNGVPNPGLNHAWIGPHFRAIFYSTTYEEELFEKINILLNSSNLIENKDNLLNKRKISENFLKIF